MQIPAEHFGSVIVLGAHSILATEVWFPLKYIDMTDVGLEAVAKGCAQITSLTLYTCSVMW